MMASDLIAHRFVGPAFPCENRVERFDALVGAAYARRPDQLAKDLAAEQPVVLQLLIGALEYLAITGTQVQAAEQIGPGIGHWSECKSSSRSAVT